MDLKLQDKVVLVTGASRGIGAAIARQLGACGATVIVNYYSNQGQAEEVLAAVKESGGTGMLYQADVREAAAVRAMVDHAVAEFGPIDVLFNNANIKFPVKPFMEMSWEEIHGKLSDEMQALYNCSQAVVPSMIERRSGKLIFVSSTLSRQPGAGFAAHCAAKSAVDAIAKVMAFELGAYGITVNVLAPGLVITDATAQQPKEMHRQIAAITPLKRIALPEDIAGTAVMLASPHTDYLTGQYISVNGGAFML